MNILILGSGGREHAIAWKVSQSAKCDNLYVAPGNAGTATVAQNVDISPVRFEEVERFCLGKKIDMLIVGPEDPLVKGVADYFKKDELAGISVIGPGKEAARLEGSKDFSKKFMQDYDIPTAAYQTFGAGEEEEGKAFLATLKPPYVLKADGLAAGKGVLILHSLKEAEAELENMLKGKFGEASHKVVIEEFLEGSEFSVFVLTDGQDYKILPVAKDYKRIGEGDTGLNTGGMGAVSPVSFADGALMRKVEEKIIKPTVHGIRSRKLDYKGFIFLGLINVKGEPYVIEYNVRMGDPETEVVIPRIKNDLVEILEATARGKVIDITIEEDERYAATVMVVSGGYPGFYEKGKKISGLQNVADSIVFHAGTRKEGEEVQTCGGRVMAFTSYGATKKEALQKSYASVQKVCYEGITFRSDIGFDLED